VAARAEEIFDDIDTPIGGVQPDQLMSVWHKCVPLLRRVVKPHTGYDLDSLLTSLQLAQKQLWVIGDFQAVCVTEIQLRPAASVMWCQFIVGDDVKDWIDDWEKVIAEFGRAHDCVAVEFCGRPGWKAFQEKFKQYKPVLVTYRKEI
jgi:hypothetical protein